MILDNIEKKNGVFIERYFYPFGRGVVTRHKKPATNVRYSVYVSDLCGRSRCAYDTIAHMTCKNCKYNLK